MMKSKISKKSKEKSDLENSDKPIIDLNNSEIKSLLKKGKISGYITHDQLNKNQLRDLLDRPFFDKEAILETLEDGPNYRNRTFETQIKNEDDANTYDQDRFEVLEFWGCVDKKVLEELIYMVNNN